MTREQSEHVLGETSRPAQAGPGPALAARERDRLRDAALRFLARGVVHRLNNSLAVFSSHAQLFEAGVQPGQPRRESRGLQDSAERARRALGLLELLTGRPRVEEELPVIPLRPELTCVGTLVRGLGDVLLCERGGHRFPVEVRTDPQVYSDADPAALLATLTLLVEHLVAAAPLPMPGAIVLEVVGGREPCITAGFRIGAGHLPFHFGAPRPGDGTLRFAADAGFEVTPSEEQPLFCLRLPPAGGQMELATEAGLGHQ